MYKLVTTNSSTPWFNDHNGLIFVQIGGTFSSGTATIEVQLPDASETAQAMEGGAFTSGPASKEVRLGNRQPVRITVSGAGSPSLHCLIAPAIP